MKVWTGFLMAGIGFTVGLLCGLLFHLPADTLPADIGEGLDHFSRHRRAANSAWLEPGTSEYSAEQNGNIEQQGTANKQDFREDLSGTDYADLNRVNLDQNGYEAIKSEKSHSLNTLKKFLNENHESVVFLNPDQQKLVLNSNNRNNVNDTNRIQRPYARDGQFGQPVKIDNKDNRSQPKYRAESIASGQMQQSGDKIENDNYRETVASSGSDVIDGIYWSDSVVQSCPKGFSKDDHESWKKKVKSDKFVKMDEGCGRMQNRRLTFLSSQKACARYRLNVDQIQGEIFSYYLSKLLGINNVPPSVLLLADSSQDQWRMVGREVASAQWSEEKPVIISQWIENLTPAYIPVEFRNLSGVLSPKDVTDRVKLNGDKLYNGDGGTSLCDLLQWSDLIVFDYLTANLDRVVNNLFNLQWNSHMMGKPAHNLEQKQDGSLVFLDNESGLFHAYRLLDKYSSYHEDLLNSLCIFKKQTIDSLRHFVTTDSISDSLQSLFEKNEPLHRYIPRIPQKNIKILKSRMNDILRQVQWCESHS